MPYSYVQYTGDGSTTTYSLPLPYIRQSDVVVTVDDVEVDFDFLTSGSVDLVSAPADGSAIEIRRETEREERLVEFVNGSTLDAERDIETIMNQLFFVSLEALDAAADAEDFAQSLEIEAGNLPSPTTGQIGNMLVVTSDLEWAISSGSSVRDAIGLGSVAVLDTGTGSANVPTNADLGSAAFKNTGTDSAQVPTNGDLSLGTAATRNVGTSSSGNLVEVVVSGGGLGLPALRGDNLTHIPIASVDGGQALLKSLVVEDRKPSGTSGDSPGSSGTWLTRTLNNAATNSISGASLASNQITLPAGTYQVRAWAVAYRTGAHRARLQTTGGSTLLTGGGAFNGSGGNYAASNSLISGVVTLAESTTIELQHWVEAAGGSTTFGQPTSTGDDELYATVEILKIS